MSVMSLSSTTSSTGPNRKGPKTQILPNKPPNFSTSLAKFGERSRKMGSGLYSKQSTPASQNSTKSKPFITSFTNTLKSAQSSHQRSPSASSSIRRSASVNNLVPRSANGSNKSAHTAEVKHSRNNSNQLTNMTYSNGNSSVKQNGAISVDTKMPSSVRCSSLTKEKNLINGSESSYKSSNKAGIEPIYKRSSSTNLNNEESHNSRSDTSSQQVKNTDSLESTAAFCNLDISKYSANSKLSVDSLSDKAGLVGLSNLGNTCFMNSVLQCLSNTRPLLEFVLFHNWKDQLNRNSKMKGHLFEAYADLMCQIWDANGEGYVGPTNFRRLLQKFATRFMGNAQQDSQEFLRYLLEGLHEDLNRVKVRPKRVAPNYEEEEKLDKEHSRSSIYRDTKKSELYWERYLKMDDSVIVDLFMGQLKSTLRCSTCQYSSTTFDPFMDLSLPIPQRGNTTTSITDCFELFTKLEILDGDERPTCSRCKARRKCTKGFTIQCFPRILVIHLKRFSGDRYRSKVGSLIRFPLNNLDLSKFAAESCTNQTSSYNLYAVSNHSGTVYAGHYTATCKHPKSNLWYDYNDTRVRQTSDSSYQSPEAYVLFYELTRR